MTQFFRVVLNARLVRTLSVGVVAVIVQTAVFEALGVYLKVVALSTAVLIGAEVAILTNFYLNNRFSFSDRQSDLSLLSRLTRFHLVVSGSAFLQWLFVFVAEKYTSNLLYIHAAYAAGIILGFAWNYTFYLLFVWRSKELPSGLPSNHDELLTEDAPRERNAQID